MPMASITAPARPLNAMMYAPAGHAKLKDDPVPLSPNTWLVEPEDCPELFEGLALQLPLTAPPHPIRYSPAGQDSLPQMEQVDEPVKSEYDPAGHKVHAEAPAPDEYVPAWHELHTVTPAQQTPASS
jgi:hypothetical protein